MLAYFKGLSVLRNGSSGEDDATQCAGSEKVAVSEAVWKDRGIYL